MRIFTSLITAVLMAAGVSGQLSARQAGQLSFDGNGQFKIVQFTDLHYNATKPESRIVLKRIDEVLESERPDLVVITGDMIYSKPAKKALGEVMECVSAHGIPFCTTFGNHDADFGMTKDGMYDLIRSFPNCIMPERKGKGTTDYAITINGADGKAAAVIYGIDSNAHLFDENGKFIGYDCIHPGQIEWYRNVSGAFREANGGTPLPALAFFHIPVPEFHDAIRDENAAMFGTRLESVAAPKENSGFFDACKEMGDIMGIFVGHDHDSDFAALWKDVVLAYGRFTGGNTEYNDLPNGARVIVLEEGKREFDTYIVLKGGEIINRLSYPESFHRDGEWYKRPLDPECMEGLEAMRAHLSPEDSCLLARIHEPVAVAVPPANARAYMCMMPDGEIRAYGRHFLYDTDTEGKEVYLSSRDCGLSWKYHLYDGVMRTATYFPEYRLWAKAFHDNADGCLYVYTSATGPDDRNPTRILVSRDNFYDIFLPMKLEGSNRCCFTCQSTEGDVNSAAFVYTDDGFRTFSISLVEQPKWRDFPYPDKGTRWCIGSGCENYVCQLGPSKLMMIQRTPDNWFYQSFSNDLGTTWSKPEPSPFHGTNTTPFMLRLSDGRILLFWNNTRPMPELDHWSQPDATEGTTGGWDEDFFTNRDAAHVAVSDDGGRTWKGARELCLSDIRNDADYRLVGNPLDSRDKSVHQFQAIELPYNKVLVAVGQNESSRRLMIFDVDWLYEDERHEDFRTGLGNVSTQVFVKSYSGYTPGNGHCAYNRTNGALLVPDPAGNRTEVVQLSRIDDPRLVSPIQGLVWNYPASMKGSVSVELMLAEDAVDISLDDCWSNPCDSYEPELALFSFRLDGTVLSPGSYHIVRFDFDIADGTMELYIDGAFMESRGISHDCLLGLSYISIQCHAGSPGKGCCVRRLDSWQD